MTPMMYLVVVMAATMIITVGTFISAEWEDSKLKNIKHKRDL